MSARGKEYDNRYRAAPSITSGSSQQQTTSKRISKALYAISKLHSCQGTGPWSQGEVAKLDKSLLELLRILDKKDPVDQRTFCALNGHEKITELISSLFPASSDGNNNNNGDADGRNNNSGGGGKGKNKAAKKLADTSKESSFDSVGCDGIDSCDPASNASDNSSDNNSKIRNNVNKSDNKNIASNSNTTTSNNKKKNNRKQQTKESNTLVTLVTDCDNDNESLLLSLSSISNNTNNSNNDGNNRNISKKINNNIVDDDLLALAESTNTSASDNARICVIPAKSLGLCGRVIHASVAGNPDSSRHLLYSNLVSVWLDWLMLRLAHMPLVKGDGMSSGATTTAPSAAASSNGCSGSSSVVLSLPSDAAVTSTLQVCGDLKQC